jgi:hypothetical protein
MGEVASFNQKFAQELQELAALDAEWAATCTNLAGALDALPVMPDSR